MLATLLTGDGRPRDLVQGRVASGTLPTAIRNTPRGQALNFNGTTQYANFGDISQYRPGGQAFTVMVYANPSFVATTYGLVSKRNDSTFQQMSFAANMDTGGGPASGMLGVYLYDGSNALAGAATTSPVDGNFHQFVVTRPTTTTLGFYVDGIATGTNYSSQNNFNYSGTEPLFVGAMGGVSAPVGGYLPGSIVYAYIWRGRVLTTTEIAWLARDPYAFVREAPRQDPWFFFMPSGGGGAHGCNGHPGDGRRDRPADLAGRLEHDHGRATTASAQPQALLTGASLGLAQVNETGPLISFGANAVTAQGLSTATAPTTVLTGSALGQGSTTATTLTVRRLNGRTQRRDSHPGPGHGQRAARIPGDDEYRYCPGIQQSSWRFR